MATGQEQESQAGWAVGMTEAEVRAAASGPVRVRVRDGKAALGTCDMHPARLNIEIDGGIVTKAWYG